MNKPDHPHLTNQILKERLEGGILTQLLPYRQWVVWRYSLVKGQWKKQPFNPSTGRAAKTNDKKPGAPSYKLRYSQNLLAILTV